MKKQCINPYLPLDEYIPDGEPKVFGDRVYIFGSHDKENGNEFCELDYVAWSASINDLSDWRFEGVIYKKEQDPNNIDLLPMYAPDVIQGPDKRFYLYYCLKFQDAISVAVCDTPVGKYQYLGQIAYPNGVILNENQPYDPSIIYIDDKVFLYFGFSPCFLNLPRYQNQDLKGASVVELEHDMLTVKSGPKIIIPSSKYSQSTSFEGNAYFEAPSIRKIGDLYYLIYSSENTHQLCYATSYFPDKDFVFGGCIISNGDVGYKNRTEKDKLMSVGNNHGGIIKIKEQWYIFYHRHTSTKQFSRQACAEKIYFDEDGHIPQVCITTSGMNKNLLSGVNNIPAAYCCNLTNGKMGALSSLGRTNQEADFPYIISNSGKQYITNITTNTIIGYKYINLSETKKIGVTYKCNKKGMLKIYSKIKGDCKGYINIYSTYDWDTSFTDIVFNESDIELFFVFEGEGHCEILTIDLRG